ncbi:MAG TPA: hypothetical protein VNH22_09715 [Blastocatellia bacterium]|jgi:hypothetical protein|nr:hypothetical protein [Blastocatellia bacterium]
MQSSPEAFPDMHVKGGLIRARFLFVLLNHGPEVWADILASLPEEDRSALRDIITDNWYALGLLDRVDRAIAEKLNGKPEDVFESLGEFSATSSLSGPYSSLLNPDIHSFLKQSAMIHHAYQDFGSAAYESLSDTSGLLTIKYETAPPLSFCASGTAYFRHAIELCGARAARVTHTRCSGRGDSVCEFYFTWQP